MFFAASLPWSPIAVWLLLKRRGTAVRKAFADDTSLFLFLGFAGRTPYSATFYSPGGVAIHPNQPLGTTLSEAMEADESTLLILRESDVARIPERLQQHLRPTTEGGHWMIFAPPTSVAPVARAPETEIIDPQIP